MKSTLTLKDYGTDDGPWRGVYGRSPAMMILPELRAEIRRQEAELLDAAEHGIKVRWWAPPRSGGFGVSALVPTDGKWVKLVRFQPRRQNAQAFFKRGQLIIDLHSQRLKNARRRVEAAMAADNFFDRPGQR